MSMEWLKKLGEFVAPDPQAAMAQVYGAQGAQGQYTTPPPMPPGLGSAPVDKYLPLIGALGGAFAGAGGPPGASLGGLFGGYAQGRLQQQQIQQQSMQPYYQLALQRWQNQQIGATMRQNAAALRAQGTPEAIAQAEQMERAAPIYEAGDPKMLPFALYKPLDPTKKAQLEAQTGELKAKTEEIPALTELAHARIGEIGAGAKNWVVDAANNRIINRVTGDVRPIVGTSAMPPVNKEQAKKDAANLAAFRHESATLDNLRMTHEPTATIAGHEFGGISTKEYEKRKYAIQRKYKLDWDGIPFTRAHPLKNPETGAWEYPDEKGNW